MVDLPTLQQIGTLAFMYLGIRSLRCKIYIILIVYRNCLNMGDVVAVEVRLLSQLTVDVVDRNLKPGTQHRKPQSRVES